MEEDPIDDPEIQIESMIATEENVPSHSAKNKRERHQTTMNVELTTPK